MTRGRWFTNASVVDALSTARALGRPLLIDLWSPTCKGCAKLAAVTYRDTGVQRLLDQSFVCIKYNTKEPNESFKRLNGSFGHVWHPDLIVATEHLHEVRRVIGYLPPSDFMAQLLVGLGLGHLHATRYVDALATFDRVVDEHADAGAAPEAMYWSGVAAYRAGGGLDALTARWRAIPDRYPTSEWVRRADCLDVVIPDGGFTFDDAAAPESEKVATPQLSAVSSG